MKGYVRKYILIFLVVCTALLCTVGASTWILLSEKRISAPTPFAPIATTVSGDISATAVYSGKNTTVSGYTVTDGNGANLNEYFNVTVTYPEGADGSASTVDGIKVTANVSFEPKTNIYNAPDDTTVEVPLKAVAYTRIGSTNTYYSSVENAVAAANATNSTASVVIIPNLTKSDGSRHELTVNNEITLNSGVSMYLPYVDDSYNGTGTYDITESEIATFSGVSKGADSDVATNRVTLFHLEKSLTVKEGASLYLGGQCGAIGVVGKYAELNLGENASINVSGNFYCYGYVKENKDNANNGNQTNAYGNNDGTRQISVSSTGYLKTALAVYDMKSAGDLTGLNEDGIFPLTLFDFPNLQTYVEINAGGSFISQTYLLAKSSAMNEPFREEIALITANTSTASVFYLTEGNIGLEYCPTSTKTLTTDKTRIYLNGNVSQGKIAINKTVGSGLLSTTIKITTEDKFLPLSYKFQIFINDGGTFTSDYKVKFLPGSLLQNNKGGTLNINNEFIFYEASDASKIISYPTTYGDARLINNGTLTLLETGKIGAHIETTATDTTATCDFTACTSDSAFIVTSKEGETGVEIMKVSDGYFENDEGEKELFQFVANSKITSTGSEGYWSGLKYVLRTVHISLNANVNYAKNLFSYQVYTADDISGTGSTAQTGVIQEITAENSSVKIVEGCYVRIDVKRHQSATLNDEPFSSSTWYLVDSDMTLVITPSEGVAITIVTDGESGNDDAIWTVSESLTGEEGTWYEIGVVDADTKKTSDPYKDKNHEVIYVMKGKWFKAVATDGLGSTANDLSNCKISTDGVNTSKFTDGKGYQADQAYYVYYPRKSCIAAGTMITLADGTQKAVENLTTDDILLVFNHETGKYDTAGITFIENDGWNYYNVINLTFSDGTHTKLIYEHALFDVTLNKYVYITESNYAEFVGHTFVSQEGDRYTEVVLTNAYVAKEYTGCYSLVTVYHLNYFIDGLLSIPGGIEGLFNIFEYGEGLKFDEEKMQADIEKYGLYTYEDFKAYIPEEIYYAFPAPYLKVAVGKGLLTFDTILQYIEQFIVKNGLM